MTIPRKGFGQEFEGYETAKPRVLSFIDHTHPTAAEFLGDAIVRDELTNHERPWVA